MLFTHILKLRVKVIFKSVRIFLFFVAAALSLQVFANTSFDPTRGASLEGDFTQGGLLIGTTVPGAIVSLDEMPVRVSEAGKFLLGFGRDAKLTWSLSVAHPDGTQFDSKSIFPGEVTTFNELTASSPVRFILRKKICSESKKM